MRCSFCALARGAGCRALVVAFDGEGRHREIGIVEMGEHRVQRTQPLNSLARDDDYVVFGDDIRG